MATKKAVKKKAVKKSEAAKPEPVPRGTEGDGDNTIKKTSADGLHVTI